MTVEKCKGDPLDIGAGVFLRSLRHMSPELASELGHVAVPVDVRGRNTNRDRSWYAAAQCAVLAWSWFTDDAREFEEAIAFAADIGAVAFIINGEKGLRGRPRVAARLADTARTECDRHGLRLGLVSYSVPQTVKNFPWRPFAEVCDFGMPEIYDREGAFDSRYPARAIDGYESAGFRRVLPACGVYQRRDNGKGFRWRTDAEIARHLALFPASADPARTAWTIGGKVPARVVRALAR